MEKPNEDKYIYRLPLLERRNLCRILDQKDLWKELATIHMKYDTLVLQDLEKVIYTGRSPSDELFNLWGQQNHTVVELFILLYRMSNIEAMSEIKHLVDAKYHVLIKDTLEKEMQNLSLTNNARLDSTSRKVLNIAAQSVPALNVFSPSSNGNMILSQENNESYVDNAHHLKPRSPLPLDRILSTRMSAVSAISCVTETAGAIPQIPYEELQVATNNWDKLTVLGKGGFGTVFQGIWKYTKVAIKRLDSKENNPESYSEQMKQSITELHCLNAYRHDNILPVYAYSVGGPQPCLVYQFMPGASLDHRLRARNEREWLSWNTRLSIATGTARGLQYLHTIGDKPLIHCDIKSANILLDKNDTPRIGDFGLAREGPKQNYTHITVNRIHGTQAYLPDEYLRAKKFSTKVDTYSFGVVLFEIATAQYAFIKDRENKFLKEHVLNYDGDVLALKDARGGSNGNTIFMAFIDIGKECVAKRPKDRPEMVSVLNKLEVVST